MDAPDTALDEITGKQLIWCGHVKRMDPARLTVNMKEGKKCGRFRITWKDGIYTAVSDRYRNGRMEQPRAMEYGSRKASPNVLKSHIYNVKLFA
jgi:hypothetical protein